MPVWLEAGLWGLLAGGALVLGATIAWFVRVPPRIVAAVMAYGSGVLISALAFELVSEANEQGGLAATSVGFSAGAVAYVVANVVLARAGARHRKRSGDQQPGEAAVGGGGVGTAVLVAVFISNLPEGLSSASGMRNAGRSARYVFGVWGGIAVASGLAALVGALVLEDASGTTVAVINAVAAGAILAMIADTMIPEAFERAHLLTGLITAAGFLTAFAVEQLGG